MPATLDEFSKLDGRIVRNHRSPVLVAHRSAKLVKVFKFLERLLARKNLPEYNTKAVYEYRMSE